MDILRSITAEHSKTQCMKVVAYVGNNPRRFKELVEVFFHGSYRITQRAAWPLSICAERYPSLATPYLGKFLAAAVKPGAHDAVKRNVVRLLQFVNVPKRLHGRVLNVCFDFLTDTAQPVAVRVFAMTTIYNIVRQNAYPELEQELRFILEDQLPFAAPAFISRAGKILKALNASAIKRTVSE